MEKWRRIVLLGCLCLSILTAKLASLKPLLTLRSVDLAEEQKDERPWTEESQRLLALPLEEYIREKTDAVGRTVAGPGWERIFAASAALDAGTEQNREWTSRVPSDDLRFRLSRKTIFFRMDEQPISDIAGMFRAGGDKLYLALGEGEAAEYLEAVYRAYSSDDFHFGSGFSLYPKPPSGFLFPLRKFGLPLLLAGLAVYIFLPRRKKERGEISYATWRLVLGDFAALLLFTLFFALPFFIVGGTVQTFTQGWVFGLIFWPLAGLGLWLLPLNAWYAGYRILPRNDGFFLESGGKNRDIPCARIVEYRPLVLTAPRWLVWAGALAAISGKGAARVGATGRALLLAGSAYGGLGLKLDDGSSFYIWVTDAMGTNALNNSQAMIKTFDEAGVRRNEEPEVFRSVAVPTGRDPSGKLVKLGNESLVWILAALPLLAMMAFCLIMMF